MIGTVVRSIKGRDAGKYYVVRDIINEYFVYVCDGDRKTFSHPKRKNRKHIEAADCKRLIILNNAGEDVSNESESLINDRIKKHLECHIKEV